MANGLGLTNNSACHLALTTRLPWQRSNSRWIVVAARVCFFLCGHPSNRPLPNDRPTRLGHKTPFETRVRRTGAACPRRTSRRCRAAQRPQMRPGPNWRLGPQVEDMVSPSEGMSSTLNLMILLTVLSVAPSILMMTTCFIRFTIVFSLLRQALGTQQLPPNNVLIPLALFLTFMVMAPVWQESYEQGIKPYTNPAAGQENPLHSKRRSRARPCRSDAS